MQLGCSQPPVAHSLTIANRLSHIRTTRGNDSYTDRSCALRCHVIQPPLLRDLAEYCKPFIAIFSLPCRIFTLYPFENQHLTRLLSLFLPTTSEFDKSKVCSRFSMLISSLVSALPAEKAQCVCKFNVLAQHVHQAPF